MPVIGYNTSSITAERKTVTNVSKIDISSTPNIISVEERDITVTSKQTALAIGFEFLTVYSPDLGKIKINGEVIYTSEDIKKILKMWRKEKKLPEAVDIEVKNFIFRRCLMLGINLSDSLQLPPPVGFPVIVPKEQKTE